MVGGGESRRRTMGEIDYRGDNGSMEMRKNGGWVGKGGGEGL